MVVAGRATGSALADGAAAPALAYVGTISEQDNVDHLVDAVAVLRARRRLKVVVAGDGSALAAVKQRARERRMSRDRSSGWDSSRSALGSQRWFVPRTCAWRPRSTPSSTGSPRS